jgi:hypothetical protein
MSTKEKSLQEQLKYELGYLVGSVERILNAKLLDYEKLGALKGLIEEYKKNMGIKK